MRNKYLYITLLAVLGFNSEAMAQSMKAAPRLVVSITIDQLRTDYLEAYAPLYGSDGFKRLFEQGLVYSNASYNFTPVDRASAIAALSTGTTPYYNSIVGAEWLNKKTLRPQNCVYDEQYTYSPAYLATSTIGDELKVTTKGYGKVFAFAPFVDAAILSAGHAADGVAWDNQSKWATSNYYSPLSSWLSGYMRLYAPEQDVNKSITDMALSCINNNGIGLDDKPDLLSIVYSNYPYIYKNTTGLDKNDLLLEGYMNLDKNLAHLISAIETKLGRERVLFVLTSTGYSDEEEEENNGKYRIPTGKFNITRTSNLLNMYLGAVYGNARYVETCYKNQIYLNHKLLEQRNINFGEALKRAQEFLLQISGIRNVYTSNQLLTSDNQLLEKIRNGFSIEKCGDLIIDVAPGWLLVNEDTHQSSTSRASFIPFPIIFYGAGTRAERITVPVFTDRIAPTIAKSIRIRAPNACFSEPLF
jgi:hypothetical protein